MKLIVLTTLLLLGMLNLIPPKAVAAEDLRQFGCDETGFPLPNQEPKSST